MRQPTGTGDLRLFVEVVHHTCAAGDFDAAAAVLYNRVFRGPVAYVTRIAGAYEMALDVLTEFYPFHDLSLDPQPLSPEARRWILHETSACLHVLGRLASAALLGGRAVSAAQAAGDRHNAAISCHNLAETHLAAGALGSCRSVAMESLLLAGAAGQMQDELVARTVLGWLDDLVERDDAAEEQFARALQIAETETSVPMLYSLSGLRYADHLSIRGRREEAGEVAKMNLRFCRGQGWESEAAVAQAQLAMTVPRPLEAALNQVDEAVLITRTLGARHSLAETLLVRATLASRGRPRDAQRDLAEVLSIARSAGYRLLEVNARSVLALVRHDQGDTAAAVAEALLAAELSERLGYVSGLRKATRVLDRIREG